ncbi:MAG: erythromycin esterase family protein [Chloroflexi bacterium]|nr:erythromycin esterase family protein [Chloroflexota bacterium]
MEPIRGRFGWRSAGEMAGLVARIEWHAREGVVLVGFGSHRGSVIAGAEWGAPMEQMSVPSALIGSHEDALHRAGAANKLLIFDPGAEADELHEPRGHRAIGVVYDPARERYGNYVPTVLPLRYDAFLYVDESRALHPLHLAARDEGEPPETFPWAV